MDAIAKIRTLLTCFNCISLLWNIITLLADKLSLNVVGILWIFNITSGILIVERYFPEIKEQWAKILLYAIMCVGHLIGLFFIFFERMSANSVICILFNIIGFILSFIYFCFKEANNKK
tara:strand:- start:430 stop:786 length:357 start_codon:yes stop_codon:yes gene_type:complete